MQVIATPGQIYCTFCDWAMFTERNGRTLEVRCCNPQCRNHGKVGRMDLLVSIGEPAGQVLE